MPKVDIKTPTLDALRQGLRAGEDDALISKLLSQWAMRFRAWAQERFLDEGDGSWPDLQDATIEEKDRHGSRHPTSILRDWDFMFHSLDAMFTGRDGQYERQYNLGVEVGIGGEETHPDSLLTIGEIAAIHHMGEGDMPRRRVLEEPPGDVISGMIEDAQRILTELQ